MAFSLSNAMWFALSAASAFGVVANLVLLAKNNAQRAAISLWHARRDHAGVDGQLRSVARSGARLEQRGSPQFFTQAGRAGCQSAVAAPEAGQPTLAAALLVVVAGLARDSRLSARTRSVRSWRVSPASRLRRIPLIRKTIDEFPQFSFLLGDMHPHVLALPFALLMMALALNLYHRQRAGRHRFVVERRAGARRCGRCMRWPWAAWVFSTRGTFRSMRSFW